MAQVLARPAALRMQRCSGKTGSGRCVRGSELLLSAMAGTHGAVLFFLSMAEREEMREGERDAGIRREGGERERAGGRSWRWSPDSRGMGRQELEGAKRDGEMGRLRALGRLVAGGWLKQGPCVAGARRGEGRDLAREDGGAC